MKKSVFAITFLTAFLSAFTQAKTIATDRMPGSNCDNVVHNDLGAPLNRTPSECEVQFDWKQRTILRNAFQKVFRDFPSTEWEISDTAIKALDAVGRGTEGNFFSISYYFKIDLSPESALYKEWYKKYEKEMEKLQGGGEDAAKNFSDFMYNLNNALHIRFYILVNNVSHSIYFMKGGQQAFTASHAIYAVKGPHVAALTGGDDNGMNACFILFGRSKLSTQKEINNGFSMAAVSNFPKGSSHLTVQNVSIRIECSNELLNKILADIDWKAIEDMIRN